MPENRDGNAYLSICFYCSLPILHENGNCSKCRNVAVGLPRCARNDEDDSSRICQTLFCGIIIGISL